MDQTLRSKTMVLFETPHLIPPQLVCGHLFVRKLAHSHRLDALLALHTASKGQEPCIRHKLCSNVWKCDASEVSMELKLW